MPISNEDAPLAAQSPINKHEKYVEIISNNCLNFFGTSMNYSLCILALTQMIIYWIDWFSAELSKIFMCTLVNTNINTRDYQKNTLKWNTLFLVVE